MADRLKAEQFAVDSVTGRHVIIVIRSWECLKLIDRLRIDRRNKSVA